MAKPPGVANGQLTDKQSAFVREYVSNGCQQTEAARAAGYADPGRQAWALMRIEYVQLAIQRETRMALSGDLSALATHRLRQILGSDDTEPKLWLDAAKVVLDRGGFVAPKAADASSNSLKELNEMSVDELTAYLVKAKSEAAQRAIPVIDLDATEVLDAQQPI